MSGEIANDREVIDCICELLSTIEDALDYISDQLEFLEFEKSMFVLRDVMDAIRSISTQLLVLEIEDSAEFLTLMKKLCAVVAAITDLCDSGEMMEMKKVVDDQLIPYYNEWRQAVLVLLTGNQFRYLQN